jgi:hypothetical protein
MPERRWRRSPEGGVRTDPRPRSGSGSEEAARAELNLGRRGRPLRALYRAARDSYDHLWAVVAASVTWVALAATLAFGVLEVVRRVASGGALALWLALALWVLVSSAVLGPLTGGLFRYARNAAASAEPEMLDLIWGYRSRLRTCLGLWATQWLVTLVLAADALFFLTRGRLPLTALGVVFGYLLLYWASTLLYQWPMLAEQELGVLPVVKKSALLVLDNLPATLVLGGACLVLGVICWAFVLPAAILWPGVTAFIQTRGLRELLPRYGLLPPEVDPDVAAEEDSRGLGWHE